MANPHRGEVSFDVGGRSYTLRFTINALCEMESAMGMSVQQFCNQLSAGDVRLTSVRAAFWAGLRGRHPELSLNDAGDLLYEMGGVERAVGLLGEAMTRSFPPSEPQAATARPQ